MCRRRAGRGQGTVALVAAVLFLGACAPSEVESPPEAPATEARTKAPEAGEELASGSGAPLSLASLPDVVARVESLRERSMRGLVPDATEQEVSARLLASLSRIDRTKQSGEALPFDELVERSRRLAAAKRWIVPSGKAVTDRLLAVEALQREARELRESLDALGRLGEDTTVPEEVRSRVEFCRSQLEELSVRLARRRGTILLDVSRLADARGRLAAFEVENESNLVQVRTRIAEQSAEPIWRLRFSGREAVTLTTGRIEREARRVQRYVQVNGVTLALLTALVLGGMMVLLHQLRPGAARRAETDPSAVAMLRVMESPWAASIPLTILALVLFAPPAPSVVYDLAWIPAAPAAAWIVVRLLGPSVSRTVWVLAASLALIPFRAALELAPVADRIVLFLQTAPFGVVLCVDLWSGRWKTLLATSHRARLLASAAWVLVAVLGVAAVGSVAGWVSLASILSIGTLGTVGGAILIGASTLVLAGLLRAVVASPLAQQLRSVRLHPETITKTGLQVLWLLAIATGAFIAFAAFRVAAPTGRLISVAVNARLTLGSMSISVGSVLTFAVVLSVAISLARIVSFVLAEEVLPRFDLARGAAFTVSVTARYLLLLTGFALAAGAAGIDLTKVGFLAGALGVGIGFGLQNIVNNFISGLILLFERPIQIGDSIDSAGTIGQVTRIGIRASTVRTFDGAEVLIPNADLISKPVTNWTLSDPNRRYDIPVGVAYGAPFEATARALLAAARRTVGVMSAPAPEAFFLSFGDSALVWTLRLWTRMEESPGVLSALRRAVAEELAASGIDVPFPQLDVYIHPATAEAPATPHP